MSFSREDYPQSKQSKKGEYSKEFARVFLKPPQSTGSFPSLPDDLFSSIQLEGEMCMGLNGSGGGGWILWSYITSTLISLASTRSHLQLTEKEAEKLNPAVCLQRRESRFGWIGTVVKSTKTGSTRRKSLPAFILYEIASLDGFCLIFHFFFDKIINQKKVLHYFGV